MKALLVILNKDNAPALEKCLASIVNMEGLCTEYDVLIMDGASSDDSEKIARIYEERYPCIEFRVQRRLGGTGYARREACEIAKSGGYDVVVWGDSENVYHPMYMRNILKKMESSDAVGGVPKVRGGFYAHAFAWYHALHLVIPGLYRYHIPGNNKAERVEICSKVQYPETLRSEDYGFSIILRKNGLNLKQEVAKNAVVEVSLPESFGEVMAWQRARAKGVAQVLRKIGAKPWDNVGWASIFLLFVLFALLIPFSAIPLLLYSLLYLISAGALFYASKDYILNFKWLYFIAPMFGVLVYSIYSLFAVFQYIKIKNA